MNERKIRVLVVDDSAFARKVIREVLARDPRVEVVGTACDGLEALEKVAALSPDVLTLDLVMPNLDGVGVLKALPEQNAPRVVVVSMSGADSMLGIEALHCGAIEIVQKPTALATDRLYELGAEVIAKVVAAASARVPAPAAPATPVVMPTPRQGAFDLVVVGTSTGGPQALTRLLTSLPATFPVPIAIALHIPEGYTEGLSRRLNASAQIEIVEASQDLLLRPGLAVVAPGGRHLRLSRGADGFRASLSRNEDLPYTPSVDLLFASAAETGAKVLGVVLTGMGRDGVVGAQKIQQGGGAILTESEASCVVYGMPRSVREAGLTAEEAPLDRMAEAILRRV
jgi:two-component system, chemotaxis family, protein-glutamate methylesterase/glutaminase